MKQCLKLVITGTVKDPAFHAFVQKKARSLGVEGTIQNNEMGEAVVFACGMSHDLDVLIDLLYAGTQGIKVEQVRAEPLLSEKDFRGVFRIIG